MLVFLISHSCALPWHCMGWTVDPLLAFAPQLDQGWAYRTSGWWVQSSFFPLHWGFAGCCWKPRTCLLCWQEKCGILWGQAAASSKDLAPSWATASVTNLWCTRAELQPHASSLSAWEEVRQEEQLDMNMRKQTEKQHITSSGSSVFTTRTVSPTFMLVLRLLENAEFLKAWLASF